jgi:hypothetical protein
MPTLRMAADSSGVQLVAKELPSKAARAAEDFGILQNDLLNAQELLALSVKRASDDPEDRLISQTLYRMALVTFMACFGSGKYQLRDSLFSGEDARLFATLREVRNGLIAHNSGALRQAVCFGVFNQDGTPAEGRSLGIFGAEVRYSGDRARLTELCILAAEEARRIKETHLEEAIAHVQSLSPTAILALNDAETTKTKLEDAAKSRRDARAGRHRSAP